MPPTNSKSEIPDVESLENILNGYEQAGLITHDELVAIKYILRVNTDTLNEPVLIQRAEGFLDIALEALHRSGLVSSNIASVVGSKVMRIRTEAHRVKSYSQSSGGGPNHNTSGYFTYNGRRYEIVRNSKRNDSEG